MSRVDKGGRSFRPLARPKQPLSQPTAAPQQAAPQPPQKATQARQDEKALNIPSSATTSQLVSTPLSPDQPPQQSTQPPLFLPELSPPSTQPPLFIPEPSPQLFIPETSPPLFIPETNSQVFIPENDHLSTPSSTNLKSQPPPTLTAGSSHNVQPASKLSAAEKMKLKAKEAKAARAAEKLKNPNSSRCNSVVNHESQKQLVNSQQGRNITLSSEITSTQVEDIPVPASTTDSGKQPTRRDSNQAWSPPIDPLLSIATFDDDPMQEKINTSTSQDILVSSNFPNYAELAAPLPDLNSVSSSITTSGRRSGQSAPPPKAKAKAKARKPLKEIIPEPSHSNQSDDEDISPRLKRKRHLEELRKKRRDKQPQTQEEKDTAQLDAVNAKLAARFKRKRAAKNKTKQKQPRKKQKAKSADNQDEENVENDAPEDSGTESDSPIDPTKVAMAELTAPHHRKGQSSQTLESRLKLIIERRDREKRERLANREEKKKLARQALLDRCQLVKSRRNAEQDNPPGSQEDELDQENNSDGDDDGGGVETQNNEDNNQLGGENQPDESGAVEQQTAEEAKRKKLMEEYGLEDLNSDSDMDDLEEVIFDEFANHKAKKTNQSNGDKNADKTVQSTSNSSNQPAQNVSDEEEEVVEENFEADDYAPQAMQYAPQLRVVDGQIVLDQDSLEVDRRAQSPQLEEMEVVEESDSTRLINSQTWSKAVRGEKWTANETSLFYDAVRLFGSDFEMITQLFPGRTRRQIRAKWNREERKSPQEITDALMGKRKTNANTTERELTPISENEHEGESEAETLVIPSHLESFDQYAKIVGIDCTGPIPVDPMDKWREKERLEWESTSLDKAKKNHDPDSSHHVGDSDDEDGLVVEENFSGWGEVDD